MPENDRQRRSAVGIKSIVKILIIVIVTVALTVLCVRSGQSMNKTPNIVYPTNDNGKIVHDNELIFHDSRQKISDGGHVSEEIANTTDKSTAGEQKQIWLNSKPNSTWMAAEEQTIKNHSTAKHPLQVNSRSLKVGMVQDERQFINGPLTAKSKTVSFDPRGKLTENNWYPAANYRNGNGQDIDYKKINQKQMNYYGSSSIETNERDDGSTDTYSTYDMNNYRYNQAYNLARVNMLNRDTETELDYHNINVYEPPNYGLQGSSVPIIDNKPLSNNNYQPSINTVMNKYPSVFHPQEKVLNISNKFKVDWKAISIMTLLKLGLIKIKSFGIINFLLFLLFKLKFFLITAFFKILLIFKFMKFFKMLVLSLWLSPVLPILTTLLFPPLFSIPRLVLNSIMRPADAPTTQSPTPNNPPNMSPSTNRPSQQPSAPAQPNRPNIPPATQPTMGRLILTATNNNQNDLRDLKTNDLNLSDERWHEPFESFDPTSDIFQKLLDSEKCVERIACRMATANQAGIINSWINWILNDASKVIPEENLEVYFKTFDDVKNTILTSSLTPDSWATWCLNRYNCNNIIIAANLTDTTQ